ncbi:Uma2 family endonuclease [Nocardia panacis]|uniref:Uma2 family endonuclease n=1 Tax=Nocardia panacis TaxID=2340916 RepID=A0A3A4KQ36_9NOCA|nr:Uma2 family endonuclease [Nocardia panacis]RJO76682.1 Uma2 family endonuclease [Nocardia panacis]
MFEAIDWEWLRSSMDAPEVTLEVYAGIPEDLGRRIEVVDGRIIRCESPGPAHQIIQHNLVSALRDAVKQMDAGDQTFHKVVGDIDMLITEVPRLHYRRPDVVVYRCIEFDRGRWHRKPYATDCLLVIEIVSPGTVITDTRDKLAEYAQARVPHYWIVQMAGNDGQAVSIERFRLTVSGKYISDGVALRGTTLHAIDIIDPFTSRVTWEQLDDGI